MATRALLVAAALLAASGSHGEDVAIESGRVSGKVLASGVRAYLGIPFAEPPVRELRWRDPQPVKPWRGVYHADRKPSMCMQQMRAHDLNHYFGEEAASEDCLYLNLWVPADATGGQKRPVLVFMYGGAFVQGTANMANYSGESLARKGVVYVAMN
jgi:para-nitrobenzyl esterase